MLVARKLRENGLAPVSNISCCNFGGGALEQAATAADAASGRARREKWKRNWLSMIG
ncbi:hypothetical protein Busp01_03130 [Trinickia caryophylli]|nr:hypothetical protein Busp01_03130 [Trinickia caryophylli]